MRPLILKMEMSIDGLIGRPGEEPAWALDYYDDELTAYEVELLSSAGVHAMGRQAYEGMSPHWPTSTTPFAKPMNEIPKAVFSRTLQRADWNETTIYRDIATDIAQLKREDGAPILAHGGGRFAQTITKLGLVDEYRLNVHPLALGDGYKLFGGPVKLELIQARTFKTGAVAYTYVRS
jgi:dihydrofolate reductase